MSVRSTRCPRLCLDSGRTVRNVQSFKRFPKPFSKRSDMLAKSVYIQEDDVMGYPMTTFELYTDEEFKGAIDIIGNATDQLGRIVGVVAERFPEITRIVAFKMNGELFAEVKLSLAN